jgi:hypothetical protein
VRHGRNRRRLWLEGLEDRMLLSSDRAMNTKSSLVRILSGTVDIGASRLQPATISGASAARRLDALPGEFDDNGVVNKADVKGVRNELFGVTPPTVFGDVLTFAWKNGSATRRLKVARLASDSTYTFGWKSEGAVVGQSTATTT